MFCVEEERKGSFNLIAHVLELLKLNKKNETVIRMYNNRDR
ncbi:hypothetical protein GGGNBK_05420 [Sporosarcina sp. ANT_H38]